MNTLFCYADKNNIQIEYGRLPENKSISFSITDEDYVIIDYSLLFNQKEEGVHLAHELGHCATGSFYNLYSPLDIRMKHEIRADKWAIKHLISEEDLDAAITNGYTEIWSLAEYFDVTEDFMKKVVCWYTYGNLDTELHF